MPLHVHRDQRAVCEESVLSFYQVKPRDPSRASSLCSRRLCKPQTCKHGDGWMQLPNTHKMEKTFFFLDSLMLPGVARPTLTPPCLCFTSAGITGVCNHVCRKASYIMIITYPQITPPASFIVSPCGFWLTLCLFNCGLPSFFLPRKPSLK